MEIFIIIKNLISNNVETIGVFFGLISVILTVLENIWCWPIGVVNVIFFMFMFYEAKLYAEMILQIFFFVLLFYGWYEWLHGGKNKKEIHISKIENKQLIYVLIIGSISTNVFAYLLSQYTDASLPLLDSGIFVFSVLTQYLQAKKILESWFGWIAVDIISIGVYHYKNLFQTEILYVLFLVLATSGYFKWKKSFKNQNMVSY